MDAIPSLKGYNGFDGSICSAVNKELVHGNLKSARSKTIKVEQLDDARRGINVNANNEITIGRTCIESIRSRLLEDFETLLKSLSEGDGF